MSAHLSTLTLHRLRYGELDVPATHSAREHLASCGTCSARLGVQERERAAFVARPIPEALRGLAEAPSQATPWWRELFGFGAAIAAAAALFLAVPLLRGGTEPTEPTAAQTTAPTKVQFRGELPAIEAWIDQGRGPRVLREDDVLSAGHRVQLAYDPRGASSVALAGRDVSGVVEVYSTNAPTGIGLVRAPFALTLDDAPGVQELFVIGSDRPLDERTVKTAVLHGVEGVRVARVAIHKSPAEVNR